MVKGNQVKPCKWSRKSSKKYSFFLYQFWHLAYVFGNGFGNYGMCIPNIISDASIFPHTYWKIVWELLAFEKKYYGCMHQKTTLHGNGMENIAYLVTLLWGSWWPLGLIDLMLWLTLIKWGCLLDDCSKLAMEQPNSRWKRIFS